MSTPETKMDENGAPNTLAAALVAAQADMPAVQPDSTNPHFKSRFVSLGHLIAKVRPVLNKHGVMVAQFPSSHPQTGQPVLVTVLLHKSGERMEYQAPLLLAKQDAQGLGSALTYTKRYALASALGISDQEDDDGNAGSEPDTTPNGAQNASQDRTAPSDKQLDFLMRLCADRGADPSEQETVRAYAKEHLTGGKEGTTSKTLELLKGDEAGATLVRLVAKADEWQKAQTDVPADVADFPVAS